MNQLLRLLMQYAQRTGNYFAPNRVGAHHTPRGVNAFDQNAYPAWSGPLQPSTPRGVSGGDQIPGMSYFWDATGRGGAFQAARETQNYSNYMWDKIMFQPDTLSVAKVVTAPRFTSQLDPNFIKPGLPPRRSMMAEGPLPAPREVVSTGTPSYSRATGQLGPFSDADTVTLASEINRQKAIEAAKSAAKVGTAAAAADFVTPTPGFFRSAGSAFLSDPVTNVNRMAEQKEAGQTRGAVGTYLGTLAQGSIGMALGAGLNPQPALKPAPKPAPAPTRGQQADSARLTAMAQRYPQTSPRPLMGVVRPIQQPVKSRSGGGDAFFL